MPVYNLIKDGVIVNTIVADEVDSIRDQYDSIELVEEPTGPSGPTIKYISAETIRSNLTFSEKVKWDNETTPSIKTAKIEFTFPVPVEAAAPVLDFMVDSGDISQASADKILAAAA